MVYSERQQAGPIKLILALLILAALAIRLYHIDQPIVTFHATRHYRSAVIARACYYRAASGIPEWARRVADENRAMQPAGEPPLMEWLACGSYLALGHEKAALPRAFAVVAWVAGAIPLYLLALRIGTPPIALVTAALYLFLPYGIVASRNFQPDALMTLCSLWAMLALVRHREQPTQSRLYVAAAGVANALLVKPMSVFLTLPVMLGLGLTRLEARSPGGRARAGRDLVVLVLLSLAPAGLYYGYGAVFGTLARDQMRMRFVPHLLISSFFYYGLLTQIRRVFTVPLFLASLLGIGLAPTRTGRVLIGALWLGYAVFAVAFTYHMPTHDYYHWPFIAAVALGTAALAARAAAAARLQPSGRLTTWAAVVAVAIAALGSWQAWPRLTVADSDATVERYRQIGTLTEHDTRVLFLDQAYGYPLMYHAELSGDAWPTTDDLAAERLAGDSPIDAETRYARDYSDFGAHYFVVTDLSSFRAQPDLQRLLEKRAVVVRSAPDYKVFKFRP